ncbi:MAG: PAS domain S-box protein [Steroidobacteraceae bacterium]
MTNSSLRSSQSAEPGNGVESIDASLDGRACFRALMSNVNLYAVMFNLNAEIIYCNGHFLRATGLLLDEVMDRRWNDVFASPWAGELAGHVVERLNAKTEAALHHESELLTRAGERYWVRWNTIALRDSSATMIGAASIGEDITERRQLESALLDSSARERRNLEGELHDGLGQELFGLALLSRSLAKSAKRGDKSIADDLERLSSNLSHAVDSCRRISRGFSPLSDVQGGIIEALRNLATIPKGWSGPHLEFSLVQAAPLKLPAETLDHIYRLAQEGLTNAVRHADATSIKIIFNVQLTAVTLEIVDNGVGLPMQVEPSAGMGLKLMRYRANVLRAHVRVARASNRGTHLIFRIEQ